MARVHKIWARIRFALRDWTDWLKRGFDVAAATILLAAAAPIALLGWSSGQWRLQRRRCVGLGFREFDVLMFAAPETSIGAKALDTLRLKSWPSLWNVLRGDLSFVGPRAADPVSEGFSPADRHVRPRYEVQPGLVCTWWIRQRANIAYGSEQAADREYVENHGIIGDLGILLRAAWAACFGKAVSSDKTQPKVRLLGVEIDNITMNEAVSRICSGESSGQISFVNPHCLNIAYRDHEYRQTLNNSALVLADGIGLQIASRWLRQPIQQNVNGTDLFPLLCHELAARRLKLFLLGGRPGVPEKVRAWIRERQPDLHVCGYHHGYFTTEEESELLERIAASGSDILLVAMGVPRQEAWIRANWLRCGTVRTAVGVGGLFDFYSVYQEPGRMWKRYLIGNAVFLMRVAFLRMGLIRICI
jgi:N-acetylglucosaminyldiphosphoundecaprenol N-acetyl-beta-D-mannosaminyltransferase